MEIGEKIRLFGEQRFESVKAFAEALGVPAATIQIYMRGDSGPGPKMLYRLRKLGCDLNWLFDEDQNKMGSSAEPIILKEIEDLRGENRELKARLNKIGQLMK